MAPSNESTTAAQPGLSAATGPSDARLCATAEASGAGAEQAFAELWRRHHQYVVHFCALRLGSRADAEDVAQNVFIKAHRGLATFRGRSRFRTWLTAIAIHECTDHHRRERRHARRDADLDPSAATITHADAALDAPPDGKVLDLLLELPLHIREVLYMRYFRELGFEEIAVELGLGLSAAKMRVYRAVERMRLVYEATS